MPNSEARSLIEVPLACRERMSRTLSAVSLAVLICSLVRQQRPHLAAAGHGDEAQLAVAGLMHTSLDTGHHWMQRVVGQKRQHRGRIVALQPVGFGHGV